MHSTQPVDFSNTLERLRTAGAFKPYENPTDATHLDNSFDVIHMPGDQAYPNGPMVIQRWDINLPKQLIAEQRKSFVDALNIYMPQELIAQHMHHYFSGQFLQSQAFRLVEKETQLPRLEYVKNPWGKEKMDESLSFKLDAPERKVNNRVMFTATEMEKILEVLKEHPELTTAVTAYQSAYMSFVMQMQGALKFSSEAGEEKEQALKVVGTLKTQFDSPNFLSFMLPAIALKYYVNHQGDMSAAPTREDIVEGVLFSLKNGAFINDVMAPDGENRHFSCPAKTSIMRSAATSLDQPIETQNTDVGKDAGVAIAHIFDSITKLTQENDPSVLKANEASKHKALEALGLSVA